MLFYVPAEAAHKIGPLDFFFNFTSRYESRRDVFFNSDDEAHWTNWLNRGRLGFDYMASPESRVRVTYQYAHINTKDEVLILGPAPLGPDFDPTGDWEGRTRQDVLEAYIDRTWGTSHMVFGRQQVDRDWLVGSNNWGEVGRAWTGVKVENGDWDFFVGRLDLDTVGEANFGSDQHLAYAGYNWGNWGTTTVYYKLDRDNRDTIYTLGHEYHRDMGNTQFSLNAATQWGRTDGSYLSAWAGVAKVKFMLNDRFSVYGAYSTASGGTTDAGTVRTFDQLYGNDHGRMGIMDLQELRNARVFSVGANFAVSEDIGLGVGYHSFSLFDEDDFWYNSHNGLDNPFGTGGGTNIGSEIDVSLHWMLSDALKLSGGFGIFDPGSAIQNLGGGNDNQTFMFVGVHFKY